MACHLCESMEQNRRGVLPHAKLTQVGEPKKVKVIGQANIYVTMYQCSNCKTKWRFENDKNDAHAGWSTTE